MGTIQFVIDFIFILVDSVFAYQVADIFLKRRWEDYRKYGYPVTITFVFYGLGILSDFVFKDTIFNGLFQKSGWIVLILLLHFFYQGSILKKIITIALSTLMITFGEVFVILFAVFIFGIQAGDIWKEPILFDVLHGISKIIMLLLVLVTKQYNSKTQKGLRLNYTKELLTIGIIDLVTGFVGTFLVQYNETLSFSLNEEIAIVLCGVFIISFVSIVIIIRLSERARKEMELKLQLQQLQLEKQYEEDIKKLTGQLRTLRHDMNNHVGVMKGLLDLKQYEELREYFSGIADTLQKANDMVLTESKALSVLLNTKIQQAHQQGIDLEIIVTKERIHMEEQDLCALIGNVLDNAMEAAKQTEEKYIFFSLQKKENEIRIKCENSYTTLPKKKSDGTFFTTKRDKEQHGIGTKVMKEMVEKYHGTQEILCADLFSLTIKLPF